MPIKKKPKKIAKKPSKKPAKPKKNVKAKKAVSKKKPLKKLERKFVRKTFKAFKRSSENPIINPTRYSWESAAVFNPAAIIKDGRVHLFYRALGADGVSRIGYVSSPDGIHFDERLPYPVFV